MDTTTMTMTSEVPAADPGPDVVPEPTSAVDAVLGGPLVPGLQLQHVRVPVDARLEDVLAQLGDVAIRIDQEYDAGRRQRDEDAEVQALIDAATIQGFTFIPPDVVQQKRLQIRERQKQDTQAALHQFRDLTQAAARLLTDEVARQVAVPSHQAALPAKASSTDALLARLLDLTEQQVAQAQLRTQKLTAVLDQYRRTPDRAGNVAWQQAVERLDVGEVRDQDDVLALAELQHAVRERQRARLSPKLRDQLTAFRHFQGDDLRDLKADLLTHGAVR